ncbi:MAG: CoA-binding domain protein [Deltaproteobacteria bacterium]|nr:CoA-binding domain protein [Deltaproteobacteria bacterium]
MRDDDSLLREILDRCRTIAVVGIKAGADDDAYRVPHYMQQHGHRIVPVSPKLDTVLGERCVASLREVHERVDLVNLFRAPQHLPAHVDEILAMDPLPFAVWFQLGIRDDASAARLRAAGVRVVQDACLMVEHARLAGRVHP